MAELGATPEPSWPKAISHAPFVSRKLSSPSCGGTFDLPGKRDALTRLETQMADAGFWTDQERARSVVQQVKALKSWVDPFGTLEDRVRNAGLCSEHKEVAHAHAPSRRDMHALDDVRVIEIPVHA